MHTLLKSTSQELIPTNLTHHQSATTIDRAPRLVLIVLTSGVAAVFIHHPQYRRRKSSTAIYIENDTSYQGEIPILYLYEGDSIK